MGSYAGLIVLDDNARGKTLTFEAGAAGVVWDVEAYEDGELYKDGNDLIMINYDADIKVIVRDYMTNQNFEILEEDYDPVKPSPITYIERHISYSFTRYR